MQSGLCATEWPVKSAADRTAAADATSGKVVAVALASSGDSRSDAPIRLTDPGQLQPDLISAHEMHLCAESGKLLLNLFNVTMHLKTWNSVVTERIGEGRWGVPVAPLFGISQTTIAEYAADQNGHLCEQVAPAAYSRESGRRVAGSCW